jgi:hypothetical protein
LGGPTGKATPAAKPPVSEFESPKLKIAGKLKLVTGLTVGEIEKVMAMTLKMQTLRAMGKWRKKAGWINE